MAPPLDAQQQAAVAELVPHLPRLIRGFLRRRSLRAGVHMSDLYSAANEALTVAALTFDPSRGLFSKYAAKKVRWALEELLRDARNDSRFFRIALRAGRATSEESEIDAGDANTPDDVTTSKLDRRTAAYAASMFGHLEGERQRYPGDEELEAALDAPKIEAELRAAIAEAPELHAEIWRSLYVGGEEARVTAARLGIDPRTLYRHHEKFREAMRARIEALEAPAQKR